MKMYSYNGKEFAIKEIKNLSQLKKALQRGTHFLITNSCHKEHVGEIRTVNVVQTNGIYSIVENDLQNKVTQANGGKGYWLEYGKAGDWVFQDGECKLLEHRNDSRQIMFECVVLSD